jgi:Ala-tRNA(Pro) deacylase
MKGKERLETYLREQGVPYQVQHHPLAYTAQQVAEREHVPGRLVAKVVLAYADGRPVLLALPAPRRVDLARAVDVVGAESVRLAEERELERAFPDCEVGATPPFGNLYGLPVYVDRTLAADDVIVCQAGTHTDTVSLRFADFERLVRPVVADFARPA